MRIINQIIKSRRGFCGLLFLFFLLCVSVFAELIANDRPIVVKYKGSYYFPVYNSYTEKDFGGFLEMVPEYKDPYFMKEINAHGWAIWPIVRYNYNTACYMKSSAFPSPPDSENWLGTDDNGYDVLARLIYGMRTSFMFGVCLTIVSTTIGILFGAMQGYFGGLVDIILQRIVELWNSLPSLFVAIIIAGMFSSGFWSLLIILALFSWIDLSVMVRAETLRVRNAEYVLFAKTIGLSRFVIMTRHVLPNAFAAILSYVPFLFSYSMIAMTSLDFLGLGLPAGIPSLGDLLFQAKSNPHATWISVTGIVALVSVLIPGVLVSNAIRDTMRKNDIQLPQ